MDLTMRGKAITAGSECRTGSCECELDPEALVQANHDGPVIAEKEQQHYIPIATGGSTSGR